MARLIVKSPYIKCGGSGSGDGGGSGASGYLKYIATRERVQIIADDRPPTRRQEQLIRHLLRDFPDVKELDEYESYETAHTKCAASALISMALEMHWPEANQSEIYLKYIATRPHAERIGAHGLFGDEDGVDMEKAMAELENYQGNVWTHIISLKQEDAVRLGYDSADAWRDLIRTHRNDIAAAMNIPPDDFRWYAAFHDEGDHPHIHMMAWSVKSGQAYLSKEGIRKIKSELANDIFRQEMLHIYEQKSESRDELVRQARREMKKLSQKMRQSLCSCPEVEKLMVELSRKLETVKGKKSYGYLPKSLKPLVDRIVDEMEKIPAVAECYETWWALQCQVNDFYSEQDRQRPPLSKQKEFRAIKNAVIQEAELIRLGAVTFEDEDLKLEDEQGDDSGASSNYRYLKRIIYDESRSLEERDGAVEELRGMAENDDPHAQYLMGKLNRDGPLLIPDTVQAREWFTRAAEQELPIAQYALGKLYLRDIAQAVDFGVTYNAATNSVYIDPDAPYQEEATSSALTEAVVQATIWALRDVYPTGTVYGEFYRSETNGPYGRAPTHCAGWATLCSDAAFGDLPWRRVNNPSWEIIRTGDLIRFNTESSGHVVVVLNKTDEYIMVTESGTNNKARWGGQYYRWWLEEQPGYTCYTRYPQ